ncbi:hypothetical protein H310_00385 [Aphanomyces invadans]|uniref:Uncharacterized protein n=1 Tax=Aphanomyces invadans TaxID=157072 RepID=A0A024UUG8_9STRA|nr:hypothetical protein H310_00385 [Aphanomyces invadans]ETW09969.1 hypothetical protein H310_00385 [Aphanomyces invadans]|eukprot:XP_008861380.1 hypothetical protein H310_00385 [Aphanomyces invadans]
MLRLKCADPAASGMASALHRFMGIYDVKNSRSWRLEDMDYRSQEIQRREELIQRKLEWRRDDINRTRRIYKLANERRLVDSRAYQLSALSGVSLVVSIFSRQAYVESHPPESTHSTLVFFQGSVSVISMLCLMLCMLRCLMLTIATLNYAATQLEQELTLVPNDLLDSDSPFTLWWQDQCAVDWIWAYRLFLAGLAFVPISLVLMNAALYKWSWFSVGGMVALFFLLWQFKVEGKWRYVLHAQRSSAQPGPP